METNVFSLGQLFWTLFNLALLIAIFAFLGWRVVRAIRRDAHSRVKIAGAESVSMPLGETIRQHRTNCKMTQEFVAESLGVSRQAVSKWESGTTEPSTANLIALAQLFGVSAEKLLKGVQRRAQ